MWKHIKTAANGTKKAYETTSSLFQELFRIFGYMSIIFGYNPTGYSYYHVAKNYEWALNSQSFLFALLGIVIFGMSLFILKEAFRMTKILGKIIFILVAVSISGAVMFSSWFDMNNQDHMISLALFNIVFFGLYGAAWPRMRWFFFRTRQVEDHDTNEDDDY